MKYRYLADPHPKDAELELGLMSFDQNEFTLKETRRSRVANSFMGASTIENSTHDELLNQLKSINIEN